MKLVIGDYRIDTDSNCFVLRENKCNENGECIGKVEGYFTTLEGTLKAIPIQVVKDNEDLIKILKKLREIRIQISAIKVALFKVVEENGEV